MAINLAKKTVSDFLEAWKEKRWSLAAELMQKTWLAGESDPEKRLETWFGNRELLGAKISSINPISEAAVRVIVRVTYKFGNQTEKKYIVFMVVCEKEARQPSPEGTWGINPISALAAEKE